MTKYVPLTELTSLQVSIMGVVDLWVKGNTVPVTRKHIMIEMEKKGATSYAVKNALAGLLRLGYLRVAILGADDALNKTKYVQLRKV